MTAEQNRKLGGLRSAKTKTQDKMVNELNAKFLNLLRSEPNNLSLTKGNNQKGKLDSSQINDGDFERIMNGNNFLFY